MRTALAHALQAACRAAAASLLALCTLVLGLPSAHAEAPVKLRLFGGGANQRPDLVRKLLDE